MQGWVSLHRKILDSETFKRLNFFQKTIAIYIILNANHTDNIWYDLYKDIEVEVERGQLVTSRSSIKKWFHNDKEVTDQKIRTALSKLERLKFLTIETTNNYTLLTVCNYNVYQDHEGRSNQADNQEVSKQQPRSNQGLTTNNNDKNVNNDKKKDVVAKDDLPYDEIIDYLNKKTGKSFRSKTEATRENIRGRFREGFNVDDFKSVIDKKAAEWSNDKKMSNYLRPQTLFIPANFESYLNQNYVKGNGYNSKAQQEQNNIDQLRRDLMLGEQRTDVKHIGSNQNELPKL